MGSQTFVSPNILPPSGSLTVTITNPVNNATFPSPTNLTINAITTDSAGTVTQVQFYVGTKLLGVDTTSPYSIVWTNAPVGPHALTAIAKDNTGLVATSSVINVSITTNLLPIADAHVRDGSYTNTNFGTNIVMECLTTNGTGNNRDIYFKFDLTGVSNISSANLRVFTKISPSGTISNTVYSVTNTSWGETTITWSNKPARITALATNSVTGTNWFLFNVTSFVKTQQAGGQNLISLALHDPTNYTQLISINSKENTTNKPVLVIVTTNNPLSISITNPISGSIFSSPTNITIKATASDNDGMVTQVQFFVGTKLLGINTNAPYSVVWSNAPPGIHSLTVVASDNAGLVVTSSVVNISISTNLPDIADAHVRDGSYTNTNFGANTVMECLTTNGTGNNRDIYFKFDVSSFSTNISSAQLKIYAKVNPAGTISNTVYSVTNTSWDESTITWSNKPARITALATNSLTGTNWFLFDITTYVKSQTGAGKNVVSLAVHDPTNYTQLISVNSKENATNNPALVIVATNNNRLSISITNPISNTYFVPPTNLTINASVYDSDGTVTQVQFFQGTTSLGVFTNAPYNMIWSNVTSGTYVLTAVAKDNGGLVVTSSVVSVIVDIAPSVTLTNPANYSVFMSGANITINGNASDADGTVTQVQFFQGTTSLAVFTNAPYSMIWSNVTSIGDWYDLTAVATDNKGLSSTSGDVFVAADIPPTVTITVPTNNTVFVAGSTINISADASGDYGVAQVEFFQGTNSLGVVVGDPPYGLTWSNMTSGVYQLTAQAMDYLRVVTTSSVVTVVADIPTVTLASPANNAVFPAGSPIGLEASTSDAYGMVTQVQFFQGTTSLGIITRSPYIFIWNNAAIGTNALTAVASDNYGITATSSVVNVTIDTPPSITLTNPQNYSIFPAGSNIGIDANATDVDGTVTAVQFFQGTNSLGIFTNAPYSMVWSNVLAGSYAVTAVATDNIGVTNTSAVVNFMVTPVSVSITNPPNNAIIVASLTNLTLMATAGDSAGTVTQVQFFQGSTSLGIATSSPYSVVWTNAPVGNYGLKAVAFDNAGYSATSSVMNITITPLFATNTMNLWLKADSLAGLTNNAPVSTWYDSSGWGNNATQSSPGNQPLYVTNTINGLPVVQFNGSSSYFNLPYFMNGATQGEALVVLKSTTPPGGHGSLWTFGNSTFILGSPTYAPTGYPDIDGVTISDNFGSTNLYFMGQPVQPITNYIVYEVSSQTNNWAAWINGLLQYQTTSNTVSFGSQALSLGTDIRVSSYGWNFEGDIAEVLVFNRALTAGERTTVNGYLDGKYGLVSPKISITSPANNSFFTDPGNVTITVAITDDDAISQVQYFSGTNSIGIVTNAPYSMVWNTGTPGTFALTAQATDNRGLVLTSSIVNVIIDDSALNVTISAPKNNAVLPAGSNISLMANASDPGGTVAQVQFFQGATSLGIVTNSPYSLVWSNVISGTYALTAQATDNSGLVTTSSVVTVIADISPTVTITNPVNNARFVTVTNINLGASASDSDGTVAWVQFFQGATSLGIVTNAPYNLIWSNATAGVYALTAQAADNNGLVSTSAVVNITVAGISITSPTNNLVFATPASIPVSATTFDNVGISQVQYFQGATSLGIVTTPPYSLVWSNVTSGIYALTARATESGGLVLTSSVVHVIGDTNPNTADTDGDGVSDYIEYLEGRNPLVVGAVSDTNGIVNLQVYTPLQ